MTLLTSLTLLIQLSLCIITNSMSEANINLVTVFMTVIYGSSAQPQGDSMCDRCIVLSAVLCQQ